jgi:hypothetical protein
MTAKELGAQAAYGGDITQTASGNGVRNFGLTKRELFAVMILQGMAANPGAVTDELPGFEGLDHSLLIPGAVRMADALLAELAKGS